MEGGGGEAKQEKRCDYRWSEREKIGARGSVNRKEAISASNLRRLDAEQLNVKSVCLSHNHIPFP